MAEMASPGKPIMIQSIWRSVFTYIARTLARVGATQDDSDEVRLQKTLLVTVAFTISLAALLWSTIYLVFNEPLAASIPFAYTTLCLLSIAVFGLTRRYDLFRFSQLMLILLLPFILMMTLGGFVSGSAVVLWALLAPVGALVLAGRRQAMAWFAAFLALVTLSGILEPALAAANNLPSAVINVFFVMNVATVSAVAFILLQYYLSQKNTALELLGQEQAKSERLLLNVLPEEIAAVLKDDNRTIADHFEEVSILFADAVGFTPLSANLAPREIVDLLNEVFSHFDALVEKYDLEKIQTSGDNYMVAAGVPRPRPDHAQALASMALEMNALTCNYLSTGGIPLQFRIGMNSGPAIAGIIGQKKFHYDLWGDAVNTASRMESHGVPGKIQISRATYELIRDDFDCTPRGTIDIKGKGEMETWFLEGVRSPLPADNRVLGGAAQ